MYESVIFLFVMHPYDVGDALFISGDWCQVEEIALQYTQVVRYDGVKIWYPNHVLCAGAVMNITRSAKRWESFKVQQFLDAFVTRNLSQHQVVRLRNYHCSRNAVLGSLFHRQYMQNVAMSSDTTTKQCCTLAYCRSLGRIRSLVSASMHMLMLNGHTHLSMGNVQCQLILQRHLIMSKQLPDYCGT